METFLTLLVAAFGCSLMANFVFLFGEKDEEEK